MASAAGQQALDVGAAVSGVHAATLTKGASKDQVGVMRQLRTSCPERDRKRTPLELRSVIGNARSLEGNGLHLPSLSIERRFFYARTREGSGLKAESLWRNSTKTRDLDQRRSGQRGESEKPNVRCLRLVDAGPTEGLAAGRKCHSSPAMLRIDRRLLARERIAS